MLQTDKDRLNDSYAALERKAELYDKLSKGQYDDDKEQYNVDFLAKGYLGDEQQDNRNSRHADDTSKPIDSAAMAVNATGWSFRIICNQVFCVSAFPAFCYSGMHTRTDSQAYIAASCHQLSML